MIGEIESYWLSLASKYSKDAILINSIWLEISKYYSKSNRYYHNLSHIQSMLQQAENFKSDIEDFDTVLFAIWYHDIIYKSTKKDNEERSAEFAKNSLKRLNFDQKQLEIIQNLILSTKKHQILLSENQDNAFLLDFDLAILGTDWDIYLDYTQKIRKEYRIYPDFVYKPGRKKVLQHFLERETLYFTDNYKERLENQARDNILKELKLF